MALECQGLTGDEDDVGSLVSPLHLELASRRAFDPVCSRGVIQAGSGICLAAHISCDDDGVTVCYGEIE